MRLPLAPATLRAGGWISAGMISTVQTPLPMRAAIAPKDCPHFCAPSPGVAHDLDHVLVERQELLGDDARSPSGGSPRRAASGSLRHSWNHLGRRTRA